MWSHRVDAAHGSPGYDDSSDTAELLDRIMLALHLASCVSSRVRSTKPGPSAADR